MAYLPLRGYTGRIAAVRPARTTLSLDDGSAAAPPLNFTRQLDSGLFRPADNQIGIAINGVERGRFTGSGLLTDYSANDLPRTWYAVFTNHTVSSASTWETATGTWSEALGLTSSKSFTAVVVCWAQQTTDTTPTHARLKVDYSLDGGTTWVEGDNCRVDDLRSDGTARAHLSAAFGAENVTLTGNLAIRVQVYGTRATVLAFNNIRMVINAVGDF